MIAICRFSAEVNEPLKVSQTILTRSRVSTPRNFVEMIFPRMPPASLSSSIFPPAEPRLEEPG
jgi:hypothetical protein